METKPKRNRREYMRLFRETHREQLREYSRHYREEHRERLREQARGYAKRHVKRYRQAHPDKVYQWTNGWRKRHPEKHMAHTAIAHAITRGKMTKPMICDRCGATGLLDAHHPDYSQKLVVKWLCRVCHSILHRQTVLEPSSCNP